MLNNSVKACIYVLSAFSSESSSPSTSPSTSTPSSLSRRPRGRRGRGDVEEGRMSERDDYVKEGEQKREDGAGRKCGRGTERVVGLESRVGSQRSLSLSFYLFLFPRRQLSNV
jgi:hypothetical protein